MFSERIRILREKNGITQAQLAKRLNVTRSSVNAWEMGLATPSTSTLVSIALTFHVSTDWLLGLEQNYLLDIDSLGEKERKIIYDLLDYFHEPPKK